VIRHLPEEIVRVVVVSHVEADRPLLRGEARIVAAQVLKVHRVIRHVAVRPAHDVHRLVDVPVLLSEDQGARRLHHRNLGVIDSHREAHVDALAAALRIQVRHLGEPHLKLRDAATSRRVVVRDVGHLDVQEVLGNQVEEGDAHVRMSDFSVPWVIRKAQEHVHRVVREVRHILKAAAAGDGDLLRNVPIVRVELDLRDVGLSLASIAHVNVIKHDTDGLASKFEVERHLATVGRGVPIRTAGEVEGHARRLHRELVVRVVKFRELVRSVNILRVLRVPERDALNLEVEVDIPIVFEVVHRRESSGLDGLPIGVRNRN